MDNTSLKDMPYVEAETITQHKFEIVEEAYLEERMNTLASEDWDLEDPERVGDPENDDTVLRNVKYILKGKRECCVCSHCRSAAGRPLRGAPAKARKAR